MNTGHSKTAAAGAKSPKKRASPRASLNRPLYIVGVGASAGGLEALTELFSSLAADTGMAFVLIQHLSPQHSSMLGSFIQKATSMKVSEAREGTVVEADQIYVIPPRSTLEIFHGVLHLNPLPEPHGSVMPIDVFFQSLAQDKRNLTLGVVLSGTGSDGAAGLTEIKAHGGITFVQNPRTAKYNGMPEAAIKMVQPSFVLDVPEIAKELTKISRDPKKYALIHRTETEPDAEMSGFLLQIFMLLRTSTKVDFSSYKYPTVMRRLKRRMSINRIEGVHQYLKFLKQNPREIQCLFDDLLIHVTEFFRDPEVFEALKLQVIRPLLKDRPHGVPIRIWVAGCSTGQEVYSIAILFFECASELSRQINSEINFSLKIYGTDISESAIHKARLGFYPEIALKNISKERLKLFFVKEKEGYRIAKHIRDCCIFSIQDVTSQPPIARLDLLSCRNLLIYLSPEIQRKLMDTFYYALNPHGFLVLGSSETVASAGSLFGALDKTHKIYSKKVTSLGPRLAPIAKPSALRPLAQVPPLVFPTKVLDPVVEAEARVLGKYSPAWVLLNSALEVVQMRGQTAPFLELSSGRPSWNITKLLRPGISAEILVMVHKVFRDAKPVRRNHMQVKNAGVVCWFDAEASLIAPHGGESHCLLVFMEKRVERQGAAPRSGTKNAELDDLRLALSATQNSLQAIIDDQTAVNQEMQTSNEEVLSTNEELQSTNEELETAKEELQSTNEELITLNDEVSSRNNELSTMSSDLNTVLDNVNISIVMVNANLCIRRYTSMAGKLLNLIPSDVGRAFGDLNSGFEKIDLIQKVKQSIAQNTTLDLEAQDRHHVWYSIRVKPYHMEDGMIDGAVIMFFNVDELKKLNHKVKL